MLDFTHTHTHALGSMRLRQTSLAVSALALLLTACADNSQSPNVDTNAQAPTDVSTQVETAAQNAPNHTAAIDKTSQDWCFSNGPIYTAIDEKPKLEALAVKDGRISYVSAQSPQDNWCQTYAGQDAVSVDLKGRALFPGFIDAHAHLLGIGLREMTLNLEGTKSISELRTRVAEALEGMPAGETLYGRGWIETHWPEDRFPTAKDLDAVSPDNPVILERADGHAVVVNSVVLRAANITGQTQAPFGGDIPLTRGGVPTGMLIDKADALVADLMPGLDEERKREAYKRASDLYARRGWSHIHAMSVDPENVGMMQALASSGDINIRVYNSIDVKNAAQVENLRQTYSSDTEDLIVTRAVKLYSDGALGSRGAALHAPYADDPNNMGLMLIKDETIIPILKAALENGVQVNAHAIGDRANTQLLNWYAQAFSDVTIEQRALAEPRWRVEHAQILSLDDISRFDALGVIPSMQPSHAIGDLHFAIDRLGVARLAGGYAWNSLIQSGAIIAGGSDAPVEVGDPRIEFYAAIHRKDLSGYSNENWYRDEKVSRQDALKMFTIWPAYAAFQEEYLGTLEVGKHADFTVFDQDIMTIEPADILDTEIAMTFVKGRRVYSANASE